MKGAVTIMDGAMGDRFVARRFFGRLRFTLGVLTQ